MNQRIKELALDSGAVVTGIVATNYGKDINPVCKVDIQKFAELIVRECIGLVDIMEKIANSTNASIPKDYDKHTYLETLGTVRGLFETHFGVEE